MKYVEMFGTLVPEHKPDHIKNEDQKYRVWNKKSEKWEYEQIDIDLAGRPFSSYIVSPGYDGHGKYEESYIQRSYNPEWIITMYTGVKDKNGMKIFEGDIVGLDDPEDKSTAVVEYLPGSFRLKIGEGIYGHLMPKDSWLVIGNIFQNPDLLK